MDCHKASAKILRYSDTLVFVDRSLAPYCASAMPWIKFLRVHCRPQSKGSHLPKPNAKETRDSSVNHFRFFSSYQAKCNEEIRLNVFRGRSMGRFLIFAIFVCRTSNRFPGLNFEHLVCIYNVMFGHVAGELPSRYSVFEKLV